MLRYYTFLALLLSAPLVRSQVVTGATFVPNNITECDLVAITVHGTLPSGASVDGFNPQQSGNTVNIPLSTSGSGGSSVPFNSVLPVLGPFAPGTWDFVFTLEYNGNVVSTWSTQKVVAVGANYDPGDYADHEVCHSGPPINLFSQLGGTPDQGGVWHDPSDAVVANGMFVPGTSPEGLYTYVFIVQPPCESTQQQVFMHYQVGNDPGSNGTVAVCNGPAAPINLFTHLGGSPDNNGVWTPSLGGGYLGTYTPGVNTPGTYTYTVPATAPCPAPTATVVVQGSAPPNAGVGSSVSVCKNNTAIRLNDYVSGEATTGSWSDPNGFACGGYNSIIDGNIYQSGTYKYVVTGTICPNDTAFVNLTLIADPCSIGIDEIVGDVSYFELRPNPAEDEVVVEIGSLTAQGTAVVDIVDADGRVLITEPVAFEGMVARRVLSIGRLAQGAYLVRVSTKEGRGVRRLMVR